MTYKIEKKEAFRIVGVKDHMEVNPEANFMRVPAFWQETTQKGLLPQICALMNEPPYGVLGISTCMDGKEMDYYIGAASSRPVPDGMEEYLVPPATWAVFTCIGPLPNALQDLQRRIITEWLPTSGYEYADAPDIELYTEGDQQSSTYSCEVWLPIVKKS